MTIKELVLDFSLDKLLQLGIVELGFLLVAFAILGGVLFRICYSVYDEFQKERR